jgi:hypothetical protein
MSIKKQTADPASNNSIEAIESYWGLLGTYRPKVYQPRKAKELPCRALKAVQIYGYHSRTLYIKTRQESTETLQHA